MPAAAVHMAVAINAAVDDSLAVVVDILVGHSDRVLVLGLVLVLVLGCNSLLSGSRRVRCAKYHQAPISITALCRPYAVTFYSSNNPTIL